MLNRAVFLDRDGTINEEINYLSRPEQLRLLDGAAEAIRLLNQAGFKVVIVTNQAGVARGYFSEETVQEIHRALENLLGENGAHVDAVYYCPHHPDAGHGVYKTDCQCRKPRPGMLEKAAAELGLDLRQAFVIGDKISDLQAGRAVGCQNILVRTGYGLESEKQFSACDWQPDWIADNLLEAARWILQYAQVPTGTRRNPKCGNRK
ncbi:MAG: D-glycero-beta-D-manno-heptose 1,7-bisphosphate 7-phosphatase [candidate division KSB1 bacterium]|nr:D-glycero-beta-D-manno-heptose 1,7-bisphosphate 7-phosphatase [candidate division KSB1 bacterium]MDZ7364298.1 D-glycero-beta-D-manno-heptose 1,7-bisphosphate 7-phosphatase [candidate division KSB1 bacterium]MDZ7405021.1 D-glycero-beta-D-manno-heptose 1,7-bisphosphate 7-phosphatase [candidate division KSB1 bacterium]